MRRIGLPALGCSFTCVPSCVLLLIVQVTPIQAPAPAPDCSSGKALMQRFWQVLRQKRDCQTIVISPLSMAAIPKDDADIGLIQLKAVDRNQNTLPVRS
eukprot:3232010-Rhodomonas_salina.3